MQDKTVSIICPIYNEEKYIGRFVQSVIDQDYDQSLMEVLLIDGRSTDNTRQLIHDIIGKHPFIKLIDNPRQTVPFALNAGIRESQGEIIVRLDAHCRYPRNYISRLVSALDELHADNVGGAFHTVPAHDNNICTAIALASSNRFGVGNSDHKVGSRMVKEVDTVPFGCYHRSIFDKVGLFDEELIRNQDDEFNARVINHGGKIYLLPDVVIDYTARDSIQKMCRMYYQYGLFKPLVNKKLGKPATLRQFVPALFLLGLLIGLFISLLWHPFLWVYLSVLAAYLCIGLGIGISSAIKCHKPALVLLMPLTFFCIHCSYGWGYLRGIYKVIFNKPFTAKVNR